MQPDYESWFRDCAAAYERSLGDKVDTRTIRGFFAESFIAAGVDGKVQAGANNQEFERALQESYAFYKAIGTRKMRVERVDVEPLYEAHDRVRVYYRAEYEKRDGSSVSIPFNLVYLLQRRDGGPKIFAFIAGDEMGLYRQHGLVNEQGRPA